MNANTRRIRSPYSAPTLVASFFIIMIMAGTLLSACGVFGSNSDGQPDTLIPTEEGNRWSARGTFSDGEQETLPLVVRSPGIVGVEGEEGGIQVEETASGGIRLLTSGGGTERPMRLKYPVEEGDSYQHTDGEGGTFRVEVAKESITVPAGEYDCILYTIREEEGELRAEVWVKAGVGPTRYKDYLDGFTYELISTNVDS